MESHQLNQLLLSYANGTLSKQDQVILFEYIRNTVDISEIENIMEQDWENHQPSESLDEVASEKIFRQILSKEIAPKRYLKLQWISWAAIAAVLVILGIYIFTTSTFHKIAPPTTLYAVTKESHNKILLPDGSIVILNNNSKLIYPKVFSSLKREVTLVGEGYFDIKHDNKHPFVVHTSKLTTTVLGTAFNIKQIGGGSDIVITVTRGKVRVDSEKKLLGVLVPDQQLAYAGELKPAIVKKVSSQKVIEWQAKDIFFKDISMKEAMDLLSERFSTKIIFLGEQGKDCRLTATFLSGESLEEILKVISAFNGAQYEILPGEVTITAKACNN